MTTEEKIKLTTAIVGVAGLIFGIVQFIQVQSIAAATPFLERKLAWCEEAVETTASIATSDAPQDADVQRFWQLYWGVMGLIENATVVDAMDEFRDILLVAAPTPSPDGSKSDPDHLDGLTGASLALAHACRDELAVEWSPSWSRQ